MRTYIVRRYLSLFGWCVAIAASGTVLMDLPMPAAVRAAEKDQSTVKEVKKRLRLELKMEHKDGKALLHLTVISVGDEPIVVDRELMFGIHFLVIDDQGDYIPQEALPPGAGPQRRWTVKQWNQRMVRLHPGKSVTRVVDLFGEYELYGTSFHYGIVRDRQRVNKDVLDAQGRQVRYIRANYLVSHSTLAGLKLYYVERDVPVQDFDRTSARGFLDVKTGKMLDDDEMLRLFAEFEENRQKAHLE